MNLSVKTGFFLKGILFLLLLASLSMADAQNGFLTGRVVDSLTHEPLTFVSIVYNSTGQGVVTNLEGNFRIPLTNKIEFLNFRYVGYRDKLLDYDPARTYKNMVISMNQEPYDIGEVVVRPAENPAHRIIKLAAENRNRNNPEKSAPFSYISYDKMVFSLEPDTSSVTTGGDALPDLPFALPDTIKYGMGRKGSIDLKRFIDKQYLFMMESVSNRKFLSQEKNKEEIIASRVSGISQPSFVVMARQFQSFSFYDNFINIANRQFLNPIATGSTDKYFFLIKDTLYTETRDTVFIISFRPYKGRNFDGMQGVLYINSNGYAVQNVLAEAYDQKNEFMKVSIQQQYDFVDGKRWFPVLLNTTIVVNRAPKGSQMGSQMGPSRIIGTGKSYIMNINFNPQFDKNDFSSVQIEVKPDAHKQPEETWKTYRVDTLTNREIETYRVIDSIGKSEHLDRTINSFETILTGYLPGRYFAFDLSRFIDYNPYEGFRFGAGGHTTTQISKRVTLGGYIAYSLRDKAFKYSGNVTLNLIPEKDLSLSLLYEDDLHESGGIRFNETLDFSSSAFIRNYMVEVLDDTKETRIFLNWRAFKFLTGQLYASHGLYTPTNGYGYSLNEGNPQVILTSFYMTEAGIKFRYAFDETFMKTPRGNKFSMGTKYPVINLNVARGLNALNGYFNYWRTELKVTQVFKTKSLGNTRLAIIGGLVSSGVPFSRLYAGLGSYKPFTIESEQSFGTMRLNEFLSDRFFGLFLKQDFGKLLFKPRGKFQPEIALVHNLGFGTLSSRQHHENITIGTYEKGYFEGGLLINNIVRIQLFRCGVGVLYRYGPYAYPETIDNFAFKLTLQFNM
jgi:hypothetical protein